MQKDNYYVCLNLNNCDICSAADVCGWCEFSQKCLPAQDKEASCPGGCMNGWVYNKQSCDGIVRSGRLGNFDPQNTEKVSTVEYSYPKYRVESIIQSPEVVTTPVLLGTVSENHFR